MVDPDWEQDEQDDASDCFFGSCNRKGAIKGKWIARRRCGALVKGRWAWSMARLP